MNYIMRVKKLEKHVKILCRLIDWKEVRKRRIIRLRKRSVYNIEMVHPLYEPKYINYIIARDCRTLKTFILFKVHIESTEKMRAKVQEELDRGLYPIERYVCRTAEGFIDYFEGDINNG